MAFYDFEVTGNYIAVRPKIRKAINMVIDKGYSKLKIGRTDNFRNKLNVLKEQGQIFKDLYIIYKTTSAENVKLNEDYFCEEFFEKLENEKCGSAGPIDEDAVQYLYIVAI